jgi:hypothetical protein
VRGDLALGAAHDVAVIGRQPGQHELTRGVEQTVTYVYEEFLAGAAG